MSYAEFLAAKAVTAPPAGIEPGPVSEQLFPFQRDIVRWALQRGRAAIFADCGLGKTPMQLEWARQIPGDVLILAPPALAASAHRRVNRPPAEGVEKWKRTVPVVRLNA